MDYVVIEGVPPYDGRYEFDLRGSAFSVREWGWIKRHAGYLPLTLDDGLLGSDAELMAVFAIVAMVRAGKVDREDVPDVWERFADAPGVVTVRLELQPRGADDADPRSTESSNENGTYSGDDSTRNSAASADPVSPIGTLASDISESRPARPWQI